MTTNNNNPYFSGVDDVKTLGSTELSILRGFVRDVLETCRYDDTGISDDLYNPALQAAEILGIVEVPFLDEDDPEEAIFFHDEIEE